MESEQTIAQMDKKQCAIEGPVNTRNFVLFALAFITLMVADSFLFDADYTWDYSYYTRGVFQIDMGDFYCSPNMWKCKIIEVASIIIGAFCMFSAIVIAKDCVRTALSMPKSRAKFVFSCLSFALVGSMLVSGASLIASAIRFHIDPVTISYLFMCGATLAFLCLLFWQFKTK